MLTKESKDELTKQGYRIIGEHSAVKTCGWTKNMINGKGGCYKLKFYGIMSNQCMQMTTSISCANRCTFCWRGYKAPVSKDWKWNVDDPNMIFEQSKKAHHKLLIGYKGDPKANKKVYESSTKIKHVALSLTGEPITYPKMNELIDLFHKDGVSTFLVTNAQYPEHIKNLNDVTQLHISLDAPNKELLKQVDVPLFSDYYERLLKSLEYMRQKEHRTTIRLTVVKGLNDVEPENYAKHIMIAMPHFIEIKSYMHVGPSTQRLKRENMASHSEVVGFTKEVVKYLPDYEIVDEHLPSRVVLVARKDLKINGKWHTWINFKKFHQIKAKGEKAKIMDYILPNPFSNANTISDELKDDYNEMNL